MSISSQQRRRRRRLLLRGVPTILVAAAAFVAGARIGSSDPGVEAAERFAAAWQTKDYEAMHAELSDSARNEYPLERFTRAYKDAAQTATIEKVVAGEARGPIEQSGEELAAVEISVRTSSFGKVSGELAVPLDDGAVDWQPRLVFPGLRDGEELKARTTLPRRGNIVARDGSPIATGKATERTRTGPAALIVGELGAATPERAEELADLGFPADTLTGNSGMERAFDEALLGTPGGDLIATGGDENRLIAQSKQVDGAEVRTTIDPQVQQAAVDALGSQFGGVAVLDARNGDVLALAGIAISAPQPPGSTMKIITAAAGLEEGITTLDTEYPSVVSTNISGREINNAHEEFCGGDLIASFAESCNSVFAPMGAELGTEKVVEYSERYGFNSPPTLYSDDAIEAAQPPTSTIPDPLGSELEAAVSAIGQGQVLATPLQIASVAQTIAAGGVRHPTSIVKNKDLRPSYEPTEIVPPKIADEVTEMMVETVKSGTGQAAKVDGAQVAGKTGTAELGPSSDPPPEPVDPDDPNAEPQEPEQDVNAWFTAFAPANKPKLAIAVMIVEADGDGGVIAAPIAQQVLQASL